MSGCGTASSECAWAKKFIPSQQWEERLTTDEKIQIIVHNENVNEFCR